MGIIHNQDPWSSLYDHQSINHHGNYQNKGIMKIINNDYHNQRQIFLYLTYIDANYVMIGPPDLQHHIKVVWSIL